MKCQKCAKPATFHITDIVEKGKHREFHFCDEHARQHLAPPDETSEPPISELAKKLIIGGRVGTGTGSGRCASHRRPTSRCVRSARSPSSNSGTRAGWVVRMIMKFFATS